MTTVIVQELATVRLDQDEERFISDLVRSLEEIWGHFCGDIFARTQTVIEGWLGYQQTQKERINNIETMTDSLEYDLLDEPKPHKFAAFVAVNILRPHRNS